MVKITINPAKDNSKNRRYKLRGELIAKRKAEAKDIEDADAEKRKTDSGLDGVSDGVVKAILSPPPPKDTSPAAEKKDDAMNHKVNHAHQRRPDKKWS